MRIFENLWEILGIFEKPQSLTVSHKFSQSLTISHKIARMPHNCSRGFGGVAPDKGDSPQSRTKHNARRLHNHPARLQTERLQTAQLALGGSGAEPLTRALARRAAPNRPPACRTTALGGSGAEPLTRATARKSRTKKNGGRYVTRTRDLCRVKAAL